MSGRNSLRVLLALIGGLGAAQSQPIHGYEVARIDGPPENCPGQPMPPKPRSLGDKATLVCSCTPDKKHIEVQKCRLKWVVPVEENLPKGFVDLGPITSEGEKQKLLGSLVFALLDQLYPRGSTNRDLTQAEKQAIGRKYQMELDKIVRVTSLYSKEIKSYFKHDPELEHIPTMEIDDTGAGFAKIDNEHIHIDIDLLRANLAAVVADVKLLHTAPSERESLVKELFDLKERIRNASSGDWTFIVEEAGNDIWDLQKRLDQFESRFESVMSFIIGHEAGHKVLGTDECETREIAADQFSSFILGLRTGASVRQVRRDTRLPFTPRDRQPSQVFFGSSYSLAGFEARDPSSCYPPLATRLSRAIKPFNDGYQRAMRSTGKTLDFESSLVDLK
jgi:hypothetical protein